MTDYIKTKLDSTINEINRIKSELQKKNDYIIKFIINTVVPAFDGLKEHFKHSYNIDSDYDVKTSSLSFSVLIENDSSTEMKFTYTIKVNDLDKVTVYSSSLDPDTDAFRPKNIFGDYEPLDIGNLTINNIVDDFIYRYKDYELKKIEVF